MNMPDSGYRSPMTDAQRLSAAHRVRRWLGAAEMDTLLGATGEEEAAERLLANTPEVTAESVEDGWDLLEFARTERAPSSAGRWSRRCGWVGGVAVILAFVGLVVGLVVGVLSSEHDDAFEALPGMFGGLLLPALGVLGSGGLVLIFLAGFLGAWARVVDARHVVGWAAGRPGQAQRGLPTSEPISGLLGWFVAVCLIGWAVGAIAGIFAVWLSTQGDYQVRELVVVAVVACLVGYLAARGGRAADRAAAVADRHLFVLGRRERGLRLDVATSVAEPVLVVSSVIVAGYSAQEFTAYPLTVRLPEDDLHQRHQEGAVDGHTKVISSPGTAPLVTVETTDEHHNDRQWQREYAGGWLVATGLTLDFGRPAWLMVRDRPERFAEEVLPLFEDRLGLEAGSITLVPPERLPEGDYWLRAWVKGRD